MVSGEVPRDGSQKASQNHLLIDQFDLHQALADRARDRRAEKESRDKIPESGPSDCREGFEDAWKPRWQWNWRHRASRLRIQRPM